MLSMIDKCYVEPSTEFHLALIWRFFLFENVLAHFLNNHNSANDQNFDMLIF